MEPIVNKPELRICESRVSKSFQSDFRLYKLNKYLENRLVLATKFNPKFKFFVIEKWFLLAIENKTCTFTRIYMTWCLTSGLDHFKFGLLPVSFRQNFVGALSLLGPDWKKSCLSDKISVLDFLQNFEIFISKISLIWLTLGFEMSTFKYRSVK